jgi:hypothetical protein
VIAGAFTIQEVSLLYILQSPELAHIEATHTHDRYVAVRSFENTA